MSGRHLLVQIVSDTNAPTWCSFEIIEIVTLLNTELGLKQEIYICHENSGCRIQTTKHGWKVWITHSINQQSTIICTFLIQFVCADLKLPQTNCMHKIRDKQSRNRKCFKKWIWNFTCFERFSFFCFFLFFLSQFYAPKIFYI